MSKFRNRSLETWSVLALALGALAGCSKEQQAFQMPPPEVAVQTVDSAAVPLDLTYTARTVGSREVEVRARVGGILLKRRYEEGSRVREGQTNRGRTARSRRGARADRGHRRAVLRGGALPASRRHAAAAAADWFWTSVATDTVADPVAIDGVETNTPL